MLIGHSNYPGTYDHFLRDPLWREALEWISKLPADMADGEYPIRGRKLTASVQTIKTTPRKQGAFEAHRNYIDLHYCLKGGEIIEWEPVATLTPRTPHDGAKDYRLFELPKHGKACYMTPGTFAIFFPEDAHMPKVYDGKNRTIKKVVVKIKADLLEK